MMKVNNRIFYVLVPLIIFLSMIVLFWIGLDKDPHLIHSPLVGKQMPSFKAQDFWQPTNTITEQDFNKHFTILNVWASWCDACQTEHKLLLSIAQSGVRIYGLNYKDQKEQANAWLKHFGNPYKEIIYDEKGALAVDLGVYGTPETFLIGPDGVIRFKWVGVLTDSIWQKEFLPRMIQDI